MMNLLTGQYNILISNLVKRKRMKSLNLVVIFLLAFVVASCSSDAQTAVEQINVAEAQIRADKGVLFVDVRTDGEVKELAYDVKNIIHIPLATLEANLDKISKDTEIITVCRSGGRSNKAASLLIKKGYTKVANMEGGIMDWEAKGFATLKDGATSSLDTKHCSEGDKKACTKVDKNVTACSKEEKAACELKADKKACCSSKGA